MISGVVLAVAVAWWALDQGYPSGSALKVGGIGFGIVMVGSVLPDIDHHSSIPRKYLGYLFVFGSIAAVALLANDIPGLKTDVGLMMVPALGLPQSLSPVIGIGVLVGAALVFALLLGSLVDTMTTHRGFTHSAGFALLFGLAAAGSLYYTLELPIIVTFLLGCLGVGGVLIHTQIGDR
jgi:hypothetical protein